jgi:hypothetical protein
VAAPGPLVDKQWKTFQWGDILANLLGSSLFLYLAVLLNRRIRRRQEIALLYQPLGPSSRPGAGARGAYAHEYGEYDIDESDERHAAHGNVWDVEDDMNDVDVRVQPSAGPGRNTDLRRGEELFTIGDEGEEGNETYDGARRPQ